MLPTLSTPKCVTLEPFEAEAILKMRIHVEALVYMVFISNVHVLSFEYLP